MCQRALALFILPEAMKLDRVLFELRLNKVHYPTVFDASHARMCHVWCDFFEQAIAFKFIQADDP